MPIPSLIEIVPLTTTVRAEITVPGSKSITNRALILAALAEGEVTLQGALWSEDTQIMVECLHTLGFDVKVALDPAEFCNRTITVTGQGGQIPPGGTASQPLELFVGNAGTAARFLAPFLCLGSGVYRLSGVPRMHERPQAALFKALRQLRYQVESEKGNDKLPARIYGDGGVESGVINRNTPSTIGSESIQLGQDRPAAGPQRWCQVSIEASSQFASALLLSSKIGAWEIKVVGENAEESPYVAMTSKLMEVFPDKGGTFRIEPDASSGSYFLAAGKIAEPPEIMEYSKEFGMEVPTTYFNNIKVANWPRSGWQIDERFLEFLSFGGMMRAFFEEKNAGKILDKKLVQEMIRTRKYEVSRRHDLGDSIMTAIVYTTLSKDILHFTDLGRLRVQECERVVALRTELTKCGGKVIEAGDTLTVFPSALHGAEIETYNDHRMAMCFAILGLKVPGIKIKNPACVKKTFPNFFQKLAAPAQQGLGAEIRDGRTGRVLALEELFAD
jgi:3-phosphoshikimate 1-carboxyvinyltransferase